MAEQRKSDYLGDVFGEWTVVAKVPGKGDRLRRWLVQNAEGVQMEVLQTGLADLALAKNLKDRHAADDAARDLGAFENAFSLTEAEADLYRRLDAQVLEARRQAALADFAKSELVGTMLLAEAVASVALDNDPECGTYSLEELNPFADDGECVDCNEGNHPDLGELSATTPEPAVLAVRAEIEAAQVPGNQEIQVAIDLILKAKVQLNNAIKNLEDLLNG